jgi:pimeloyl-ACP methyl ester carboxylesterase
MRSLLLATALLLATTGHAIAADLRCNQEPENRFYWVERAFCDLDMAGPERALGLVIWNHGISGTLESWKAAVPPVFRVAQSRGWDVIAIKRNNLAETMPGGPLDRTVKRTLEEAAAQRSAGYKKIVLAGQSFGGYATLEAIDTSPTIDAAIAFSPGIRTGGASGSLDPTIIERIVARARVGRLALVFPKDDVLFGSIARGARAQPILAQRDFPWLMIDETVTEITGHGGGTTGRFALRYGACLADFLSAPALPPGRFTCPFAIDVTRVVRELLLPAHATAPSFTVAPTAIPAELQPLVGPRWALVGDTLALVAPIEEHGRVRLMYRTTPSGGIWDATVDGKVLRAVLGNKATVELSSHGGGTVTWVSADKSRTLKGTLTPLE